MKFSICPKCGANLVHISGTSKNSEFAVCTDSTCRTAIKGNIISEIDMNTYSKMQHTYEIKYSKNEDGLNAYMLLKEDLSAPLLVKLSNDPLRKDKNSFCIVNAKDEQDALDMFKVRFQYIRVTPDMVVEVRIKEVESWK